jgi:hypothetical protein
MLDFKESFSIDRRRVIRVLSEKLLSVKSTNETYRRHHEGTEKESMVLLSQQLD